MLSGFELCSRWVPLDNALSITKVNVGSLKSLIHNVININLVYTKLIKSKKRPWLYLPIWDLALTGNQ